MRNGSRCSVPSVEDETFDHLYMAEQNRDLALVLFAPEAERIRPRRADWAGVVAFYSSVHFVNAYLWEARRFVPQNHGDRNLAVGAEPALQPMRASYRLLRTFAFLARYGVPFAANEADVRNLVDIDLRAVEAGALRALGLPVPSWHLPELG